MNEAVFANAGVRGDLLHHSANCDLCDGCVLDVLVPTRCRWVTDYIKHCLHLADTVCEQRVQGLYAFDFTSPVVSIVRLPFINISSLLFAKHQGP